MKLFLTRQKGAVCAPLLADFFKLVDHASQLLTGEAVDAVAELAGEVCPALLAQNVLQLLRAEGEQRALRALARAVAAVFDGRRLQDLKVEIGKHRAQEVCRIGIVAELIRHAGRGVDAALDLGDGILARAGEELNEIAAGGYLIQLLPGAGEDTIAKVEGGIYAAPSVTNQLRDDPDPANLLRTVLSDFDLEILETTPIEYRCYCSRERTERALLSLGSKELEDILREQGRADLTCQFCDRIHSFSGEELRRMIDELKKIGK